MDKDGIRCGGGCTRALSPTPAACDRVRASSPSTPYVPRDRAPRSTTSLPILGPRILLGLVLMGILEWISAQARLPFT